TYAIPQAKAERRSWVRTNVFTARWPLLLVLFMQATVCVTTLHNTAFQDEGLYLYAGRQIVHHWAGGPAPLDHYAFYFSGYPDVYPAIGGFLDSVGGLELARTFSLLCMLGVTAIVWWVTRRLFDGPAALFASAAYALTGVVLFLGRLATFDAMCLFFIALATALAVQSGTTKRPWSALAIGPLLVVAILTKYAALLFVPPVLGLLVCLSIVFCGWWRATLRLVFTLVSLAVSLGVAYVLIDHAAFHALSGSTTNRAVGSLANRVDLFTHVWEMGGVLFAIALIGLVLVFFREPVFRLVALNLFAAAWLAPVYHIYMREPISLDKHIAYGLFFAVPLAGYALGSLSGYRRSGILSSNKGYWLAGVSAVLVVFTLGLSQSQTLYSNWANTSALGHALHTQLRDGAGRIQAEDIEVTRFEARDVTKEWQWSSFYYPYYVDAKHHELFGRPALIQGLKERYWDVVELSFNYFYEEAYFFAGQMAVSKNYDLIAVVPFENSYGRGHFYLFRSALVPGQGHFTSLAQLKRK
ncbi:MAG: hypothetical protein QOF40_1461, partial [Actinomycetota bacterium]|nr:hypothetical protein [Actinomycetota bacterium]